MKAHFQYLKYVLKHKLFVFLFCIKNKVPFYRAVLHDLSKFSKTEWAPYANNFFNKDGSKRNIRDASGAYNPNSQPEKFKRAWLSHQQNLHHWQAWCSIGDNGVLSTLEIPETYIREMLSDWQGAGRAQIGKTWNISDTKKWYDQNKSKMILHHNSMKLIEKILTELK